MLPASLIWSYADFVVVNKISLGSRRRWRAVFTVFLMFYRPTDWLIDWLIDQLGKPVTEAGVHTMKTNSSSLFACCFVVTGSGAESLTSSLVAAPETISGSELLEFIHWGQWMSEHSPFRPLLGYLMRGRRFLGTGVSKKRGSSSVCVCLSVCVCVCVCVDFPTLWGEDRGRRRRSLSSIKHPWAAAVFRSRAATESSGWVTDNKHSSSARRSRV